MIKTKCLFAHEFIQIFGPNTVVVINIEHWGLFKCVISRLLYMKSSNRFSETEQRNVSHELDISECFRGAVETDIPVYTEPEADTTNIGIC